MIKLVITFMLFASSSHAGHIPTVSDSETFSDVSLRYLKKMNDYRFLSEIRGGGRFEGKFEHHFKLGVNYRLLSFLKLGLHYRVQKNVRNDDNWVRNSNLDWEWSEGENNYESVFIPELILRSMLFGNFRGELRFHYEYNADNTQETLKVRPNITYFWFRNGKAFVNIYLQYEHYLPLNYGNKSVSQRWAYLGFLYHLNSQNKIGFSLSQAEWVWTDSKMFQRVEPTENYDITDKTFIFGLNYIFTH